MMETIVPLAIFIASAFVFPAIAEFIQAHTRVDPEVTRKGYHIVSGAFVIGALALVPGILPFLIAMALFTVLLPLKAWGEKKKTGKIDDRILGPFYFTLAQLLLVVLWFDHKPVIVGGLAVTTLADAIAALVGRKLGRRKYAVLGNTKSLEGSATFFGVALLALAATLWIYGAGSLQTVLLISLVVAVFATLVEAISVKGTDNLTVTMLVSFLLYFMLGEQGGRMVPFLWGVPVFAAIFFGCYRLRFVDGPAGVASFIVSALVFGIGGWPWIAAIATFFFSVSIVTRMVSKVYQNPHDAGRSTKDVRQALANGLTPLCMAAGYCLTQNELWWFAYLAVLSTQTSDAMSSEVGGLSEAEHVYSLPTLQKVQKGVSGGVTTLGSLAGVLGASLIAGCALLRPTSVPATTAFGLVLVAGLLGNLVDSLLGGTLQVRYRCSACGQTIEQRHACAGATYEPIRGLAWMTNDTVNVLKSLFGAAVASAGWAFFMR